MAGKENSQRPILNANRPSVIQKTGLIHILSLEVIPKRFLFSFEKESPDIFQHGTLRTYVTFFFMSSVFLGFQL
jgi:hypothetical protein